jgi:hypothetical protein
MPPKLSNWSRIALLVKVQYVCILKSNINLKLIYIHDLIKSVCLIVNHDIVLSISLESRQHSEIYTSREANNTIVIVLY